MTRSFACALIAITLLTGCRELQEPVPDPEETVELPEQELYDANITFFKQDKLSTVLRSGRIRKYEAEQTILLDSNLIVEFYDEDGNHTMTLWADSGRANERTRDVMAAGNVIAVSDSGERLETSILRWDNLTRRVISDAPVKISTPTDTIFGTGFVADQHLKNWTIERPEGKTFRERPPTETMLRDSISVDTLLTDSLP